MHCIFSSCKQHKRYIHPVCSLHRRPGRRKGRGAPCAMVGPQTLPGLGGGILKGGGRLFLEPPSLKCVFPPFLRKQKGGPAERRTDRFPSLPNSKRTLRVCKEAWRNDCAFGFCRKQRICSPCRRRLSPFSAQTERGPNGAAFLSSA